MFFVFSNFMFAQTQITLNDAVRLATINNSKIRMATKNIQYRQALVSTAYALPATAFFGETGQINSAYVDKGIGVNQAFSLPLVYKRRAELLNRNVIEAEYALKMNEFEVLREVEAIFLEYNYLSYKQKLIIKQDSLYTLVLDNMTQRFQNGETDLLEKTFADQQKINFSNQLATIERMKEFWSLQLDWLINDGNKYMPLESNFEKMEYVSIESVPMFDEHPLIQSAFQENLKAKAQIALEKSNLLPEFNLGLKLLGIKGTGADDNVYNGAMRFTSMQIGMNIPIFRKGVMSSVHAAKVFENLKMQEFDHKKNLLRTKFEQLYMLYQEKLNQISTYEQTSLTNAAIIKKLSNIQYVKGEINFMQYAVLLQQANNIEIEYIEMIRALNNYAWELKYLTLD